MTAEDLASYAPEWVDPISIEYRGWRVYELPPNGQGKAALEMLNIMETSPAAAAGAFSARRKCTSASRAMKLAYAEQFGATMPTRAPTTSPSQHCSPKAYARKRAALIKASANCTVPAGRPIAGDTT